ncbi:E3 ubiquitin-protein ligase RZF1-like [Drosophila guanche]|uniref:Blast:E3 ubiquitin-protein ligase RNF181 homolog n=1 Tax=Drosophila guanche TaxID=7266 RepID=A0A3B0KN34_DROGU|nr:E3 ubiquitin-protein ligase RZF1-like [Drosophila guanche]SPP87989.1 blast:E3 ubiquitin-protein ligase RNF181 homolog [Drosophila guanche]
MFDMTSVTSLFLRRGPVADIFLSTEIAYVDELTAVDRDEIITALSERKVLASELVGDDKECSVCKESHQVDDILKSMPCKHEFHKHCLIRWLREARTCPLCRCNLQGRQLVYRQFSRFMEMQSARTRHPLAYRNRRAAQLHMNRLRQSVISQGIESDSSDTSEDESDSNGHQEPFLIRTQQLMNRATQSLGNSASGQGDTNRSDSNGTNADASNSISEGDSNRREN